MAGTQCETSTTCHNPVKTKPVVVRVKRKADQEPLDAFWLEINDRPAKKQTLDIEGLSISGSKEKVINEVKSKKLLVQHVETVDISNAAKDVLQSYLPNLDPSKDFKTRVEERKAMHKQDKQKQEHIRSALRQKHEDLVRNARFEQIWKSRKEKIKDGDDSLHEICHLYDVVQVDTEDENPDEAKKQNPVYVDEKEILCNYLPLIREYLPLDAEEIESEINSYAFGEENVKKRTDGETSSAGYVYDLYTVNVDAGMEDETASSAYPLVQVDHEDDYYDGPSDMEYETDDSNAENNPMNDYPDEITSEEEEEEVDPFFSKENEYDSEYEEEEVKVSDEEDEVDWRWNVRN